MRGIKDDCIVLNNLNPKVRDEPFNQKFKHPLEFNSNKLTNNDYDFAAIMFEDKNGNVLFREDVDSNTCNLWAKKDYVTLWKEYQNFWPKFNEIVDEYNSMALKKRKENLFDFYLEKNL